MAKSRSPARSRIGLYRPGMTSPDRLERTTVGREEMLRDLLEKLGRSAVKKTHQHYAFIGPRGVGKTHFLSLLVHRIESSEALRDKFTIVRFAEETHRLLSFADFLLRICEILAQSPGGGDWPQLYAELDEEQDDRRIIDTLEPKINRCREETGRTLLLLLENLDEVLTRQVKGQQDIHRLRKFLLGSPSCILVATAPIVFPRLTDVKDPFYDFFDVQVLDTLTRQQTLDAIRANLEYDGHTDLLARFDELSPKIKALYEMTGGNPRLVMMHYALIADEDVLEVKQQLEELLDQVSPFYQDRLRDLPPQERAVLETMALVRTEPKTPALIARKLRKSPQQASSLLKRLTKSGYLVVMDHPDDRRSKIYRIKEGFFDIWLSMNESRTQRKRLPALAQFFEMWYERGEREGKRRALVDRLLAGEAAPTDAERSLAALDYLSDAGPDDERIDAKLHLASVLGKAGQPGDAAGYLDEIKALKPGGIIQWATGRRDLWMPDSPWPDPIQQVEEMIACWRLQRAGQLEQFAARLMKLGSTLQGNGLHEALADLFLSSAAQLKDPEARILLILQAGRSQETMGDLHSAEQTLHIALQLARDARNRRLEGSTLNNISQICRARGDYHRALEYLEQSLGICREIADREGEATALNNIASVCRARGDYDRALTHLEQSLAICREIADREGEATALDNIASVCRARGDYDRALTHLEKALVICRQIGNRIGEGRTLNNISPICCARGHYDAALEHLEQALAICHEIGDRAGEGSTLNNIAAVYEARGDRDRALEYLGQSLAIRREIGDRPGLCATLFNVGYNHLARKDAKGAMRAWLDAYRVAREIGEADALHALEDLAKKLGRPEGLKFWESLSE